MSKQTINIGASPNDGTGTPLRTSFDYTNQNFTEIYTALGGGVALPGATTQVIFNDGGTNLAGDAGLVYNKTTDALTVAGLVTAGSATITGDLTVATNRLVVNASGVCIGTTTATPFAGNVKTVAGAGTGAIGLTLYGGTASTSGYYFADGIVGNETYRGYVEYSHATDSIAFATAGANRYTIDSTGIATWLVAGTTAMTLNSTGLLIGTTNNFASSRLCVQGTAGTSTPDVTIGIPLNASSNTNLAIGRSASTGGYIYLDAYKAGVGGTELVLNSINGGTVLVGLSTVVAAGGCLQLRSGVTFPITAIASSDAKTLDDYEEGVWTPTVAAETGTIGTTVVNSANYTKVGRLVSVTFDITITTVGTGSNGLKVSMPFSPSVAGQTCGALREYQVTGNMGQVYKFDATNVLCKTSNNLTLIVANYRIMAGYTYFV